MVQKKWNTLVTGGTRDLVRTFESGNIKLMQEVKLK